MPPDSFTTPTSYSDLISGSVSDVVNLASTYTPNLSSYTVTFADSTDTTISLSSVMLWFDDTTDYFQALDVSSYFTYDSFSQIQTSFSSYTNTYADFEYDAINNGVADPEDYIEEFVNRKFARLYNMDNAVRIGDSMYVEFFNKDAMLIYDLVGSNHDVIAYKTTSSSCPNQNREPIYSSKWYDSKGDPSGPFSYYILAAYKFNLANFFEARVEFGFKLHRYIAGGSTPFYSVALSDYNIWLDRWSQCCYKKPNQSNYTCKSDEWVVPGPVPNYNPHYIVARRYSAWTKSYCVSDFERTHNWVWDYYQDVHHDIW